MIEEMFLFILADIIVETIESNKQYSNLKSLIIREGHFNGRVYSRGQMSTMVMRNFARFFMVIAQYTSRRDFDKMMTRLTDEIYRAAESDDADYINQAHARKKTAKRKRTNMM